MKRLKELRQKNGAQHSVYKYENGLVIAELDILIHMVEIFETLLNYLVESNGIPFKYKTYNADTSFTRSKMHVLNYYRHLSSNAKDFVQKII